MSSPVTNSSGINFQAALASGDIQTIIQMVQSERVRLLDSQLVDQVQAVQARNDKIAKLNEVLSGLTAFQGAINGTEAGSTVGKDDRTDELAQRAHDTNLLVSELGITDLGMHQQSGNRTPTADEIQKNGNSNIIPTSGTNVLSWDTTKGDIDAAITKIKGLIDAESNNQQMDMLRLQSLNNKKNESVEILTNTQKKHTDSASGIIRNL